tara:strand:+ start:12850 stop:14061 length:1212 start_codon:yes stop_codon:yes gene_type:complete
MNLGSKVPVPEVDELRMARMERGIVSEVATLAPAKNSSYAKWTKVAVGMVAVAGVVLAIVLNLRGAAAPGTSPDDLYPTTLVTGPGQSDRLLLGDAEIDVEENTNIAIQRSPDGATLIVLVGGSIHCEVEPRKHRPVFRVRAGDVDVTVVGTSFDVTRDATVVVAVQHGIVSVATSHETLRLHAGELWQGSPDKNVEVASLLPKSDSSLATPGALGALGTSDEAGETAGKTGDEAMPGAPKDARKHRHPKQRFPQDGGTVKLRDVLKNAKPIRPVVQPSHGAKARELLKAAAENPKKAVVDLEQLGATATGHEASFALYSRAYLLYFKLGKSSEVAKAAKQYDRRFPRGREAEDMLWLRVLSSCDSEQYSSPCRAAAHTYRQRYPQGVFQGLASRIIRSKQAE